MRRRESVTVRSSVAAPYGLTEPRERRSRLLEWLVALYVAALLIFGGGGSPAPLAELACEILAVITLAIWVALAPHSAKKSNRAFVLIACLISAPIAAQLIPLPPFVWQNLPGRETFQAALALIGEDQSWRTWSIAPHRTFASLLSLGPPLLALWLILQLNQDGQRMVLRAVAGVALVSVAIGAAQLAQAGPGPLDFYGTGDSGVLHGFQANRNAEADVLLIGLLALALTWRELHHTRRERLALAFIALSGLLLLGIVLTGSRTGIALAPLTITIAWAIVRSDRKARHHPTRKAGGAWWVIGGLSVALGLAWLLLSGNPALARVIARFDLGAEFRPELWRDSWTAVQSFWPVGSGAGTFSISVLPFERLEVVDATLPNRAHNEMLEAALEGGVPLLLCWAGAILLGRSDLAGRPAWRPRLAEPNGTSAAGPLGVVFGRNPCADRVALAG